MIPYDPTSTALLNAGSHETLWQPDASYSLVQIAAECARLAYLSFENDPLDHQSLVNALGKIGYTKLQCFVVPEVQVQLFGAYSAEQQQVIVAFRGMQNLTPVDWMKDMRFTLRGLRGDQQVHSGIDNAWVMTSSLLRRWLSGPLTQGAKLCLTGHGLGGTLAARAALELPCEMLVTLGAPKTGNAAFARAVNTAVPEVHRFVNCCDVVPHAPQDGRYSHVDGIRYIDRHGYLHKGEFTQLMQENDSAQAHNEWLVGLPSAISGRARVMMREMADHAPINYVRALYRAS